MLFLGGDNPTKGAHDVLRLWLELSKLPGFGGELQWFGNVSDSLRRRVRRLPCSERIYLRGRTSRDEMFKTAARSHLLLMLSRVEPFGMVTVEAMSMGCLPVAWDIDTGTREVVRPEDGGCFAPLGNFRALGDSVMRAWRSHERCSARVAAIARDKFSAEAMWKRYEEAILEISSLPPATRPYAGQDPPPYRRPIRCLQLLPEPMRKVVRRLLGASPRLGRLFADLRGF